MRILPDHVTITSYPGPDRFIKLSDLQSGSFIFRRYRTRRIGEFLKELNMTEGRGTGTPKILRAIKTNGSPAPCFETDDDRTYFVNYFPVHPLAVSKETTQVRTKSPHKS
ncbi:MAG: ATP-binding protein [Thermodesulfobacteriota bacterium]|nr:ATP-binding protein [Thermodesulfobacteriota bacterium]